MKKLFFLSYTSLLLLSNCEFKRTETAWKESESQNCFQYGDSISNKKTGGCSSGFVYKELGDRKCLVVSIDTDSITISPTCQTYSIDSHNHNIIVMLDIFEGNGVCAPDYCTDVIVVNCSKPTTYTATQGRVIYSKDSLLNVKVEDLILVNPSKKDTIKIKSETFYQVDVSNWPG